MPIGHQESLRMDPNSSLYPDFTYQGGRVGAIDSVEGNWREDILAGSSGSCVGSDDGSGSN